jgi:hypothetical protein
MVFSPECSASLLEAKQLSIRGPWLQLPGRARGFSSLDFQVDRWHAESLQGLYFEEVSLSASLIGGN